MSDLVDHFVQKGQCIEDQQKQTTLFDMKQFQQILRKELTKETPDIPQLKNSLVTTIEFSEHCDDPLVQPLWILIINIVAMDLSRLGFFLMRMEYVFFEHEK